MLRRAVLFGAAPAVAGTRPPKREEAAFLLQFRLRETPAEVRRKMGPPDRIAGFGAGLVSWQYHVGQEDHHDFSHAFCFRESESALISVTRNTEEPETVDSLFPPKETFTQRHPETGWPVRVRRMSGGRILVAAGVAGPGQPTTQLIYIRESETRIFLPWLTVYPKASGIL